MLNVINFESSLEHEFKNVYKNFILSSDHKFFRSTKFFKPHLHNKPDKKTFFNYFLKNNIVSKAFKVFVLKGTTNSILRLIFF